MKPPDFEKFFFRLNVLATVVVFILIVPTTKIFASWFPHDKRVFWFIPASMMFLSALSWLLASLLTPWFFKKGLFDERRHAGAAARYHGMERLKKRLVPILNLMIHLSLIVLFCYLVVLAMQGDALSNFIFFKAGE